MHPDHHDHQWLDQLLSEQQQPELPDHGFSGRVLGALPKPRLKQWQRNALILASTALGCLLALFVLPGGAWLSDVARSAGQQTYISPLVLTAAASALLAAVALPLAAGGGIRLV